MPLNSRLDRKRYVYSALPPCAWTKASSRRTAAQCRGPVAMANQNELLGAAFCKEKLSLGSPPQPQLASAQEINTSCFRPRPSHLHRVKLSWAAPGSLGPAALLVVSQCFVVVSVLCGGLTASPCHSRDPRDPHSPSSARGAGVGR